ncbi:MAG: acyl-ACP--UDP-N-acetylglucosamine O-acyltransferase [Azospirillaceae bacterium]
MSSEPESPGEGSRACSISPLAVVDPKARIGVGVTIGPFTTVGPEVEIGDDVTVDSHVVLRGRTRIGARTRVFPHASLGLPPQDLKYKGEPTALEIGRDCVIREYANMDIGTAHGGGVTRVGDFGYFMAGVHIAHDCQIGARAIFANHVTLGGHVRVGEQVFIGGLTAIQQFCRIGRGAYIGGMNPIRYDVIPFGATGQHLGRLAGINIVGLKRQGVAREAIRQGQRLYRALFLGNRPFAEALVEARAELSGSPVVDEILAFIDSPRDRALLGAQTGSDD